MQAWQSKTSFSTSAAKLPACHRCTACTKSLPKTQGPRLASIFSCKRCTSVVYKGSTSCTSAKSTQCRLLGCILATTALHPSCSRRSPQQQQIWKPLARPKGEVLLMATAKATTASASQSLGSGRASVSTFYHLSATKKDERSSLACSCVCPVRVCQ